MEQDLISKKELLELTGISYGQLYRWKRKKVIPEEWFMKIATFTGQETFFPREEVLERINKIITLKDEISLDDMANMFSSKPENFKINEKLLLEKKLVSVATLTLYKYNFGNCLEFNFSESVALSLFDKLLKIKGISIKDLVSIIEDIKERFNDIQCEDYNLIILKKNKLEELFIIFAKDKVLEIGGVEVVEVINLKNIINSLKEIWIEIK